MKHATTYLKKQGNYWYYQRRVPKHMSHLDQRKLVRRSTKTKYLEKAISVAAEINRQTELYWEALADGKSLDGNTTYEEAIKQARILGINYKTVHELADGKLVEIINRLELLEHQGLIGQKPATELVLGAIERPDLKLEALAETYFQQCGDILSKKTSLQIRKWKNPRLKAVRNLIALIGNKPLQDITRNDALTFRNWWMDRVQNEHMDIGSANKDIGAINQMLNEVSDKYQLGLKEPFARMRLRGEKHNRRPPFDPQWVQDKILAPGALNDLNQVCQAVVYMMAFTGMRPSEIVGLEAADIKLDEPVPHIKIRANKRSLKTDHSERDIPLVGEVLTKVQDLMKKGGFKDYQGRSDQLSANINKHLKTTNLLPTENHTLYSLRHTFQDRLIEVECPERIQAELMGHKYSRPKYGKGPSLEQKAIWLKKVGYEAG